MNKMEILTSKWMMIACIVITFGVILFILGKKSVHIKKLIDKSYLKDYNLWKKLKNRVAYV